MKPNQFFCILLTAAIFIGCRSTSGLYLAKDQLISLDSGTARVVANPHYDKVSGFRRFMLGDHYRKEWATEIQVEVFNIDTVAGGLTPTKMGGGKQTKSLRLKGADGKEYVLRSINKDPTLALPPEFAGTFADDVLQDQISSSHPYAAIVVAELGKAAGIYYIVPRIVYVPNSPKLGEFDKEIGNTLCLFEERPVGDQEDNEQYDFSQKVVTSEKMLEKFFGDNDHRMDERFFLKARFFDMIIGDWDRHEDQWVWATFEDGEQTFYKPIPRDRDQAFPSLDGLVPQIAARKWAVRKTQNFSSQIRDVNGFNMNGIHLDRNFTVGLTLKDWLDIADSIQQDFTDAEIEAAFRKLPPSIYEVSAQQIISKMKARRNDLKRYATTYYYFLNKEVNIVGTQDRELFEVTRMDTGATRVAIHKINKKGEKEYVLLDRVFVPSETKEIRLYGLGDSDVFDLKGESESGILVRIIGGNGVDSVIDQSIARGKSHATRIYDSTGTFVTKSGETKFVRTTDTLLVNYRRKDFKYNRTVPRFAPGYNVDDGIYIGGGVTFIKHKFGKEPFQYVQSIAANYAFATSAYNFWYDGLFKRAIGKWDFRFNIEVNAPNYVFNYFGLGNETTLLRTDRNFNRVRSDQYNIGTGLTRTFRKKFNWDLGVGYQSVEVEKTPNRFVSDVRAKIDSTNFSRKHFGFAHLGYRIDNTDNPLYPRGGIRLISGFGVNQNLRNGEQNFPYGHLTLSGYMTAGKVTFALRSGVATIFSNEYEFYQANTLGGMSNLRGYRRTRFSGRTSLYENTEIRWRWGTMNAYIIKGQVGMLGFADVGRVWIPNEVSKSWHIGYGAGLFLLPYNKLAFTVTYGMSDEDQLVYVRAGFLF